jgi:hypothetical protein
LDKFKKLKEEEINKIKQKIKENESSIALDRIENDKENTKITSEFESLKNNLSVKEENYKKIIKTLLKELKDSKKKNLSKKEIEDLSDNDVSINNGKIYSF